MARGVSEPVKTPSGRPAEGSRYTGGGMSNLFLRVFCALARVVTLGLATPAISAMNLKYRLDHTIIGGKRLRFDGNGREILARNVLWVILSVVTFGIFLAFKSYLLMKWKISHTHFSGVKKGKSRFTGRWYQYIWISFAEKAVTALTLTFGYYWAFCYRERWMAQHTIIDGYEIAFTGGTKEFFIRKFKNAFLTVVTLGIYHIFANKRALCWKISHIAVPRTREIPSDPVPYNEYRLPIDGYTQAGFIVDLPAALFAVCGALTVILAQSADLTAVSFIPIIFTVAAIGCSAAGLILASYGLTATNGRGEIFAYVLTVFGALIAATALAVMTITFLILSENAAFAAFFTKI